MSIQIDKEKLLFHLQGRETSYVMQVKAMGLFKSHKMGGPGHANG